MPTLRPPSVLRGTILSCLLLPLSLWAADHNDPNAINSIFSDVEINAADLYDLFGFPSDDPAGGEKVVVALTFAAMPATGTFDPDLLYRILIAPGTRNSPQVGSERDFGAMLKYARAIEEKYVKLKPAEVRVTVGPDRRATVDFFNFPGGSFQRIIETNQTVLVDAPGGYAIKVFIGGRDDAFFNDLPGFFRSINYAPQFYHVPHSLIALRELKIPKTLIELDGNTLFNFDPAHPLLGQGEKQDLPSGPLGWAGNKFLKDGKGNYRFVYSGRDAQAGKDINAIILELPLAFLTKTPASDRIVNTWGESWVRKASSKVATIPDDRPPLPVPFLLGHPWVLPGLVAILGVWLVVASARRGGRATAASSGAAPSGGRRGIVWPLVGIAVGAVLIVVGVVGGRIAGALGAQRPALTLGPGELDAQLAGYKLIDTDGQAFADAALNGREDDKQLGAFNIALAPGFTTRLAHLGWGFGPSISALGLKTAFDHSNSPVSVYKTYASPLEAFPRVKDVIFQELNMPDNTWNKRGRAIPLKRSIEIFVPNVCAIDMDTTGTWPYGRRLEDQVATRFLSLFLDMSAEINGKKYTVDTLGDQALWDHAAIMPKTPPNPLRNDREFLKTFPYLAEPWQGGYSP